MKDTENPYAAPDHGIDRHKISDPSDDDVVYLGFWKRVVAWIADNILIAIVCLPIYFLIQETIVGKQSQSNLYSAAKVVMGFVLVLLFWQSRQATPGKMMFSGRIVDARTGGKPSFGRLVLRYLCYLPSGLVLCLGFIWVAFDKQKRGWHDLIAGTLVVAPKPLADRRRPPRKPVPAAVPAQSAD